ncbi:hypothetical protein AAVH_03261 [Aphelenchoides avenae]|nr:hypothetical protein AAVH_03261 [Aphelenchus avenae]
MQNKQNFFGGYHTPAYGSPVVPPHTPTHNIAPLMHAAPQSPVHFIYPPMPQSPVAQAAQMGFNTQHHGMPG